MNKKKIVPYRLKQARISRGFSMSALGDYIGVTRQAISQYELGLIEPKPQVLNQISDRLNYPISFFYKEVLGNLYNSSFTFFRSRKTAKAYEKKAADMKIHIFKEINDYLEQYVDFPEVNLPTFTYPEHQYYSLGMDEIESVALYLRGKWDLGTEPIQNLISVVQKNGFLITEIDINGKKLDGFSKRIDGRPYIFLSDNRESAVRNNFSIAHELGHMLLHVSLTNTLADENLDGLKFDERMEEEANLFAGAFLLPESSFSEDVFSTSLDHFINLKKKWKVSIAAMIYRCESLGLLNSNQIEYLKRQMTQRKFWRKEPLDNEIPIEKPFLQKQAIHLLVDNKVKSKFELVEDIALTKKEIEKYCYLKSGYLSENINIKSNIISLK